MDEIFPLEGVRRLILGLQGLWPGRRWTGKPGVLQAFESIQALQMDPLNVVARSHDLALHSRVSKYSPDLLTDLLYKDRALFDYGGGLFIYPMHELPYWQVSMRHKARQARWVNFASTNTDLIDEMRAEVLRRGPVRNRDFKDRARVSSYRARKDSGLALYYLWLTGELMTSRRENFEKVYDFAKNIASPDLLQPTVEEEALAYFGRKALAFYGLLTLKSWKNALGGLIEGDIKPEEALHRMESLQATGKVVRVRVEGWKDPVYLLAEHYPLLVDTSNYRIPTAWEPTGSTTLEEVRFLAPLDIVSARGRAKLLFGFDYVWEVYKPEHLRRWGYYTLPVLYGDTLPARIELKLDKPRRTLLVKGFWLEQDSTASDAGFSRALAVGLESMADFVGAEHVDLGRLEPDFLRARLADYLGARSGE